MAWTLGQMLLETVYICKLTIVATIIPSYHTFHLIRLFLLVIHTALCCIWVSFRTWLQAQTGLYMSHAQFL